MSETPARARRYRRSSGSVTANSESRKNSLRLFGRSASLSASAFSASNPDDDTNRRTFLAKPPAPGAARRVLAVLNNGQKSSRRASPFTARRSPRTNPPPPGPIPQQPPATAPAPTAVPVIASAPASPRATHYSSDRIVASMRGAGYADFSSDDEKAYPPEINISNATVWKVSRRSKETDEDRHSVRSESASSSLRSAHAAAPALRPMDVDASEVSDELTTPQEPTQNPPPQPAAPNASQSADGLLFIDDMNTAGVAFDAVDDKDDVPEAPTSYTKKLDTVQAWAAYDQRINQLQLELDSAREEKVVIQTDLTERNRELQVLVESLRARTQVSRDEVEELTRQLKDTRKRLTRRIRDLEDDLSAQRVEHQEESNKQRALETQLRAEIDLLRGNNRRFSRTGSSPSLTGRRQRAVEALAAGSMSSNTPSRVSVDNGKQNTNSNIGRFVSVRSARSLQNEGSRRRSDRVDSGSNSRMSMSSKGNVTDNGSISPRTIARRSLIRRAFIAHIHSARYKTMRSVWTDFLGADNSHVTPEQFSRAVRSLAVASDARDRDLEILREEVCGAEFFDTGIVTWAMFVHFYQHTKNEST